MDTNNEYYVEPIIIERNETGFVDFIEADTPYELNAQYYQKSLKLKGTPKLSISILSWNNLESAKWCAESVLKYAEGLDYELVLMDNASEDDNKTYDYFQQVPYKRKKVIQTTNNEGSYFSYFRGLRYLILNCDGDYILLLNDDQIVTENAIQNMVRALDSDPGIGLVNPMSSNVQHRQNPNLEYTTDDEMFKVAAQFNKYDPAKWEERIYIVQIACMFRKELIGCYMSPNPYSHEPYIDLSIRREGYRAMLLGDTWVHHNHDYMTKQSYGFRAGDEEKRFKQHRKMISLSKHYFQGFEHINDIAVLELEMMSMIKSCGVQPGSKARLLGIDVAGGQVLLDLKNRLRTFGVYDAISMVFGSDVRFYHVLYSVADVVRIDRIEYMQEHLDGRNFDYIILGKPVNLYDKPLELLKNMLSYLNKNGTMLFKLRNAASLGALLKILGLGTAIDNDMPAAITEWDVINVLQKEGFEDIEMNAVFPDLNEEVLQMIENFLHVMPLENIGDLKNRLISKDFIFAVTKPG